MTPEELERVSIPDPLPLRNIEVPREVTAVAGCTCGGMTLHRHDCSLRSLPPGQAQIEIEIAQERLRAYTAELNRRLHESGFLRRYGHRVTDYTDAQESAPSAASAACRGKSFEHHERTEVTDPYGSRWRCPDCGDSGTFEALFTSLLALQPMFERALEQMLADRVMFLLPSEATPGHLGQCFGRPVHRVRGIDGPMVAFGPSPLDVTVAQAVAARAWQAEAEASS